MRFHTTGVGERGGGGGVETEGWGSRSSEGWEVGYDDIKSTTMSPVLHQRVTVEIHVLVFGMGHDT